MEALRQRQTSESPQATERGRNGEPVAPKDTDFEDWAAYQQAQAKYQEELVKWHVEQRDATRERERTETAARQRAQKFAEQHDDYDDVTSVVRPTPALDRIWLNTERGPELVYYLGQHPQEYERFAAMNHDQQMLYAGELLARMSAPPSPAKPKAKPLTAAPAPVEPVGTSAIPAEPSEITSDGYLNPEWEQKHMEKLARRR